MKVICCDECARPCGVVLRRGDDHGEARRRLIGAYRGHIEENWWAEDEGGPWDLPGGLPEPEVTTVVFVSAADNAWLRWIGVDSCAEDDTYYYPGQLPEMPAWWNGFNRAKAALSWDCCHLPQPVVAPGVATEAAR